MSPLDGNKHFAPDESFNPIKTYNSRKFTRKEQVMKKEIDSYRVSDIDDTSVIYVGNNALPIFRSLELPDAECDGLTFKQRLVKTDSGDCLLLARWKPDRYMRRTAPAWSQKWFVEKKLFPPNSERFFQRIERSIEEEATIEGES